MHLSVYVVFQLLHIIIIIILGIWKLELQS